MSSMLYTMGMAISRAEDLGFDVQVLVDGHWVEGRIAAQDGVGDALNPLLTGPSAIAFGTDEAATAKAVIDATRPYNRIVRITGGVLGDRAIDADAVTRLAALPAREVLLAKLAGGMQAPVAQLAGLFAAPLRNLGYALQQVAEQKAKAGEA